MWDLLLPQFVLFFFGLLRWLVKCFQMQRLYSCQGGVHTCIVRYFTCIVMAR